MTPPISLALLLSLFCGHTLFSSEGKSSDNYMNFLENKYGQPFRQEEFRQGSVQVHMEERYALSKSKENQINTRDYSLPSRYETGTNFVSYNKKQARCSPPCENGGTCLSLNNCRCHRDYRGPQCQYKKESCNGKNLKFNGGYNCTASKYSSTCSLKCPNGVEFEFSPAKDYTCIYTSGSGVFQPQPIPQCVFGSGKVTYNYTQGYYSNYTKKDDESSISGESKDGQDSETITESYWNSYSYEAGGEGAISIIHRSSNMTYTGAKCSPPCKNGGNCFSSNNCQCPQDYRGPQCQYREDACSIKRLKFNGGYNCSGDRDNLICAFKCPDEIKFEYTPAQIYTCHYATGVFQPQPLPQCVYGYAKCSPPCKNGGNCLSSNNCRCPQDYRGPQCQYRADSCSTKKLQFNGGYNCSGNAYSVSCSLQCPDGIKFEYRPARIYTCTYASGVFQPQPIPQCVYGSGSIETYNKTEHDQIQERFPSTGTCFTWGGAHYKTFDGVIFSGTSDCAHTLVRDARDNTFSVVIMNSPGCKTGGSSLNKCHKIVKLFLQDKDYTLTKAEENDEVPVLLAGKKNKRLPLPGHITGLRSKLKGQHVVLYVDTLGLSIRWDGNKLVQIDLTAAMWNRTEGLCGGFDGDKDNDKDAADGRKQESAAAILDTWKVHTLGDECDSSPSETSICSLSSVSKNTAERARGFCSQLLSGDKFSLCKEVMDIDLLMDACQWDYCACAKDNTAQPSECACQAVNMYVRQCRQKGVQKGELIRWRDEETCPIKCTGGRVYKACGPAGGLQPSCGDTEVIEKDTEDLESCEEGCYCPYGTVLNEGQCIDRSECPCKWRGKSYSPGKQVPKECNNCTCIDGQWKCTEVSCAVECSVIGDPHYRTFDGKRYDFMGKCSYYLVKAINYAVEAENVDCNPYNSFPAMNSPINVTANMPSCTKTLTVRTTSGYVVRFKQNKEVTVNGKKILEFPHYLNRDLIRIASSVYVVLELENGMAIYWDGITRVYVTVPASFRDTTKGLCGTLNSNQKDDFLTPEGDVEQSIIPFVNKWKVDERCEDVYTSDHPCQVNVHNKAKAEEKCGLILSDLFNKCHWLVDPQPFYENCLYDMCFCGSESKSFVYLCPIIASYAKECAALGNIIEWRQEVRDCGVQCPGGGQIFQTCGNSCSRSCSDISAKPNCRKQCVEGCNCPEGKTLNEFGDCIPIGQCPCRADGLQFPAGYKEIRPSALAQELCVCTNALWLCRPARKEEISTYPNSSDRKTVCSATKNQEFTTCEPAVPTTCRNMHDQNALDFSSAICRPGCKCKTGYVLQNARGGDGVCVKPDECACHHGGKSYSDRESVKNDCNNCICTQGKWSCTHKNCPAVCSVWGDSHYKTFDGRTYDYQGQCDYVFAIGSLGKHDSFEITVQSEACGTLGVSCSRSVSVSVARETLTLTKDKPIPNYAMLKRMSVRQTDLYVIVEVEDLGVTLQWDRGTRVYVRADPRWKGRVKGMCGNYNDDQMDDFQTPSGGISEVSPQIFGDSWKIQPHCPPSSEVIDACALLPERRVWASKKCGILKTAVFAKCHSEVPVEGYLERCVFDACACDQGGDCECLCTALAAYAQECNLRGVAVNWRNKDLCPMQCDEHTTKYSSCVTTCPRETCDNLLVSSKLGKLCMEESCVEGCAPKECPPGQVYLNSSAVQCVPRATCKPVCMELDRVVYSEGDLMEEDDCHKCYCTRTRKVCTGKPCADTTMSQDPNNNIVKCQSGWTPWMNQDKPKTRRENKNGRKFDIEPLPTALLLNSFPKRGGRCNEKHMREIQCRTVEGHIDPKATGLDVECSLERGLICKADRIKGIRCPDFEMRILCSCGKQPKPPPVIDDNIETNATLCPPNYQYSECGVECHRLCLFYTFFVRQRGLCHTGSACEAGCIHESRILSCPPGMLWRDDFTCVMAADCVCNSHDGKPVKPGKVFQESECELCQCIDNHYTCDRSDCISTAIPTFEPLTLPPGDFVTNPIDGVETETPPEKCDEEKYTQLLELGADWPISDASFSASSVLNQAHQPWHARLGAKLPETSAGAWSPKDYNRDQYLQVDLERAEPVYGVIILGNPLHNEHVTSFFVKYSQDPSGKNWKYVKTKSGTPKLFQGNIDQTSPVLAMFDVPVEARYIRVNPRSWYNEISLRLDIIGCSDEVKSTPPTIATTSTSDTHWPWLKTTVEQEMCDAPMGVDNQQLSEHQLKVSSEKKRKLPFYGLQIDGPAAWQPLANAPNEWVKFNFLEPRNLTGVITKGGPIGWVSTYKVLYSHDDHHWNLITNNFGTEITFLGNFDQDTPYKNMFDKPIKAQYLKVVPKKWMNNIQMRVEPLGCFEVYPTMSIPITAEPSVETSSCNNCPGVDVLMFDEKCQCPGALWWDGSNCISRVQCPCQVGLISYPVGTVFEKEDCSICLCALGGTAQCQPKKCEPCEKDLRATVSVTCGCVCKPCPQGQILCPTSQICLNSSSWCNGIVECPDDEMNCENPTTIEPPILTTKATLDECPPVVCPPGFEIQLKKPSREEDLQTNLSPIFNMYEGKKTKRDQNAIAKYFGVKWRNIALASRNSAYGRAQVLPRIPVKDSPRTKKHHQKICLEFICEPINHNQPQQCPEPRCPPGYSVVYHQDNTVQSAWIESEITCESYNCHRAPVKEDVCNIKGRTFNTFDGTEYKYDICNHVLARDFFSEDWDVSLVKNCSGVCTRDLVIRHGSQSVKMFSDLSFEYNGYRYTAGQTEIIGANTLAFAVSRLGNTVIFVSNHYGFWIIWNKQGNVKLGVTEKLIEQVDGLCGFYDKNPKNDKRKPNGKQARTSVDFGDSWVLEGQSECEVHTCPLHLQNRAFKMCQAVHDKTLHPCHHSVVDLDSWISRCLETACTSLEEKKEVTEKGKHETDDEVDQRIRCTLLESFVVECFTTTPSVNLEDWRMRLECPALCPAPLVYHDCYRRRCEPSCSNLAETDACPILPNLCFPGCYCPAGLVRKKDKCVTPRECRDCECNVLPHLAYVTFDSFIYTANTNCTYIMARDRVVLEGGKKDFEVHVSNAPCPRNIKRMCTAAVSLLVNYHRITITRGRTQSDDHQVFIDDIPLDNLPFDNGGVEISKLPARHVNILIPKLQLELRVYHPTLGASLKVPSHTYGGKMEGICGDCDRNADNDNKAPDGLPLRQEDLFLDSWRKLEEDKYCVEEEIKECNAIEQKDASDPCYVLLDPDRFGQCHLLLDPTIFLLTCLHETCGGSAELSCSSLETYALGCRSQGLCIDWHTELCPAKDCPAGIEYQLCGPPCAATCDNFKGCEQGTGMPMEGCFCPEGLILKNGTECVEDRECHVCDDEGHYPGDSWSPDACTSCTCESSTKTVRCRTRQCPAVDTVCEPGFEAIKVKKSDWECCEKYACAPANTTNPECAEPKLILCGEDQIRKLEKIPGGCHHYVCECKPAEECVSLMDSFQSSSEVPLPEGMEIIINDSGCCPREELICKPELCSKAPSCTKYHYSVKQNFTYIEQCCPEYKCLPPPDKCLFTPKFTQADAGGERKLRTWESDTVLLDENATVHDGPCRVCKCQKIDSPSETLLHATCTKTECPVLFEMDDFNEYVLKAEPLRGQCCPIAKRVSCKHLDGTVRKPGEKWPLDAVTEPCTVLECKEIPGGVVLTRHVVTCDTNCKLGSKYVEPRAGSGDCCGSCKQVACAVDGEIKNIGVKWKSEDFCTEYKCVNDNGAILVSRKQITCPEISKDLLKEFKYITSLIPGECCKKTVAVACLVGRDAYYVGETWADPAGDPCVSVTCLHASDKGNDLTHQRTVTTCNHNCRPGWSYEILSPEICCGECIQVSCVVDGTEYAAGETWTSDDLCTTFECEEQEDGTLSTTATQETCPDVTNCPQNNLWQDGCCTKCNIPNNLLMNICKVVPVAITSTVGIIMQTKSDHGVCLNIEPIAGFVECHGQCKSGTEFDIRTSMLVTSCSCCQALKYTSVAVELYCPDDGYKFKKQVTVPSECRCTTCGEISSVSQEISPPRQQHDIAETYHFYLKDPGGANFNLAPGVDYLSDHPENTYTTSNTTRKR